MLGNHVNVSARKQTLLRKVLCVFLAVVLLGLMIPHGITASLNAYAEGENAAEQPAADQPAVTEENSSSNEYVSGNKTEVPVNDNETNVLHNVVDMTFPAGVYIDDTNGAGTASLPEYWSVATKDDNKITKIHRDQTLEDYDPVPTRRDIIDELNIYCAPNGEYKDLIKGLATGSVLEDFIYHSDPTGIELGQKIHSGNYNFEAVINTTIVVNTGGDIEGVAPEFPKLMYWADGKSPVQYTGWPDSTTVLHIQNGSSWSFVDKTLKISGCSLFGSHTLYDFIAKLECDNFDFNGFTGPESATTGSISSGITFTGTWVEKPYFVKLLSDWTDNKLPEGVSLWKSVNDAEASQVTKFPFIETLDPTLEYKAITWEGYETALQIGDVKYGFKLTADAALKYKLNKWQYSETEDGTYSDVETTASPIGERHLFLRVAVEELPFVLFSTNLGDSFPSGGVIKLYKQVDGGSITEASLNEITYFGDGAKFKLEKPPVEGGYEPYAVTINNTNYFFKVNTPANASANFKLNKWIYDMGESTGVDVPSSDTDITNDLKLTAIFEIKVTFDVAPEKTPAWGKVVDAGGIEVSETYAIPGDELTLTSSEVTLLGNKYKASASEGYEWASWSTNPASLTTVPEVPFTLTANFGQTPIIKFAIEDVDGKKDISEYVKILDPSGNPIADLSEYIVPGLAIGSTYNIVNGEAGKLQINSDANKVYTLLIDDHYVSLQTTIWYLDNGEQSDTPVGTNPVSLDDGESITLVAKAKYDANLKASGKIVCENPQNATVRADIAVDAGSPSEKIVDTQFPAVGNDGKYVLENLPHNVTILLHIDNAGYNYHQDKASVATSDITINDIALTKDYSFSYGKLTNKEWKSDSNSKKIITCSEQPTSTDYYSFTKGATINLNYNKVGDILTFVNLKGTINNAQLKVGEQTITFGERGVSATLNSNDIVNGVVTVTFLDAAQLDFIAVHAVDRVVKFSVARAEGSTASGWFATSSGEVTSVSVNGLGVTFSANAEVLTFSDNQTVTATADNNSIFRKWNVTASQDVLEDIEVTATFVQKTFNVKFVAETGSQEADIPDVLSVNMDSVFTSSSSKLDASAIFTKDQLDETKTISIKAEDKIKYKFANPAFTDAPASGTKINEEYLTTIEKDGLKLTYKTLVRERFVVTIDLNGGKLVSPYTIPVVENALGGDGAWTANADQTKYTNHFYEDYPYNTTDGVLGIRTWLTSDKMNIDRYDGYFLGTWTGDTDGTLIADASWKANYSLAHHILGTVTEKVSSDPIVDIDIVATSNRAVPISPSGSQLKVKTDSTGKYDLKLYDGAQCTVQAGNNNYIEKSQIVILEGADVNVPFELEKGYTFIPKDFDKDSSSWKSMFEAGKTFSSISGAKKAENLVNLEKDGNMTYASSNTLQPGDTFVFFISGAATSVTINNGFDETVEVKDGKIEYRVWNANSDVTIKASDNALGISRIEYHVVEAGSIITYAGVVKDKTSKNPLQGVDIKFVSGQTNETIETETNVEGKYYLLLSSPATGVITFVDGDYLDEKIELNNVSTSKMDANEDLVEAIHVSGIVYYEDYYTKDIKVAKGVTVSYTSDKGGSYDPWTEDYHGAVTTGDDGSYVIKLRKTSNVSGGVVWFNLRGFAQGKYILIDASLNPIPHTSDISEIGDVLVGAGASVEVSGDTNKGHKTFNVKNYLYGVKIADFNTVTSESMDFAAAGEFYAGYDEFGNHILRYVYNPDKLETAIYVITMAAIAQDDYTFWAWRCDNPVTGKKTTLYDDQKIELAYPTDTPYKFSVDYAESTNIIVGANPSEGHGGWSMVYKVNGVEVGSYVLGPDKELNFSFPNTKAKDPSNDASEAIESSYSFDGSSFIVNLSSEFAKAEGGTQQYNEVRIFTPIPAEGYMFTGMYANDVELSPGYSDIINSETPALNVLAKYSLIVNPSAQTGDNNNFWWLIALAVFAFAGIGYGLNRREKGIRR